MFLLMRNIYMLDKFVVFGVVLTFLTVFSACDNNRNIVNEFPEEHCLSADNVNAVDSLFSAYSVINNGKYYIFTQKSDCFFKVFDDSFREINDLAFRGHGNNEWYAPLATGQFCTIDSLEYFYVLERVSHKLYKIPINFENSQRVNVEDFDIPGMTSIRYVFEIDKGLFFGALDDGECEFFTYNSRLNSFRKFEHSFSLPSNLRDYNQFLLQTQASFNAKQNKIAITYYSYPLLSIRDVKGNILAELQIGNDFPFIDKSNVWDVHNYFLDITSSDNYIYLLYDIPDKENISSVLVFDWDGNPVARYDVDKAVAFSVNEENKFFLTINEDDSNGKCSIYSF